MLDATRRGDAWAAGQVCDRHGAALVRLACAILGDPDRAESVVVEVVARACADPDLLRPAHSLRHELARLTYLRCGQRPDPADRSPRHGEICGTAAQRPDAAQRSESLGWDFHQRAAVALVQFGDHDGGEVAHLLGLPTRMVAGLLCSALRDLQAMDRCAGHADFRCGRGFPDGADGLTIIRRLPGGSPAPVARRYR